MSGTRKLRSERDVIRGTAYVQRLDAWAKGHSKVAAITELFDLLVEHGQHTVIPRPPRVDGVR